MYLNVSFTFITGLSDFITRWYCQLDRYKVYDKSYCFNFVCKLVHSVFEEFPIVWSGARYAYMGSDTNILSDSQA